jgi:hypothetical protein
LALEAEVADLRRQLESRLAGMDAEAFGELIREWALARRAARREREEKRSGD